MNREAENPIAIAIYAQGPWQVPELGERVLLSPT